MSAFKNVKIAERLGLQLRMDAFNAFNHGNPSSIDTGVDDGASYGTVNGWHDPRSLQLGVKIKF